MSNFVYIVGSVVGCAYHKMFERNGWEIADTIGEADLIQFIGGADVSPHLYGEFMSHPSTYSMPTQDLAEVRIFMEATRQKIPMAGICRGGQFLNVMCGGTMHQDSRHHAIGGAHMMFTTNGERIPVSSTHHQIMRPAKHGAHILAVASDMPDDVLYLTGEGEGEQTEVVYYQAYSALCYQPHPELVFSGNEANEKCYFDMVEFFLMNFSGEWG